MMTGSVSKSGGDNSSSNNMSGKPPFAGLVERGGKFIQSSTFNTNRGGAYTTSSSNIHRGGNSGGNERGGAITAGGNNRGASGSGDGSNVPTLTQDEMAKFTLYLEHLKKQQNQNK